VGVKEITKNKRDEKKNWGEKKKEQRKILLVKYFCDEKVKGN